MRAPNRTVLPPQATFSASVPGEITLSFPDNKHASALFGQYDQNLAKMERGLGVVANAIGNQVTIKGRPTPASAHATCCSCSTTASSWGRP